MSSLSVAEGDDSAHVRKPSSHGSTFLVNSQTVRVYVSSMLSRLRERATTDTLRPLPMFLGVTGPAFCMSAGAFTAPARHMDRTAWEKIRARVKLNLNFFLTNYALVTLGVAVVVALLHPGMLFFVGIVWGLWLLHEFILRNEVIVFGKDLGSILPSEKRSLVLSIITVIVIVWKCLVPFLSVVITSGILVFFHAIMRDPKHIESAGTLRGGSADSDSDSDSGEGSEVMVERGDII